MREAKPPEVTPQALFKRCRRPGDMVFALLFLLFSLWILSQLNTQTTWSRDARLTAQAPLWPSIAVIGMSVFAFLHALSTALSPRIPGRWKEIGLWVRSLEYALWFMVYVYSVPLLGYLFATLLVCLLLALRAGYRSRRMLSASVLGGLLIVLVFQTLLQVRMPTGQMYEQLPAGFRLFMQSYF